jgi:hypothetical protein
MTNWLRFIPRSFAEAHTLRGWDLDTGIVHIAQRHATQDGYFLTRCQQGGRGVTSYLEETAHEDARVRRDVWGNCKECFS